MPPAPSASGMPLVHRLARGLAVRGWRGGNAYWGVAEGLVPWAREPEVELLPGLRLPIDRDDWISANVYRGLYERPELSVLPALVGMGELAVDVGANRGLYTALLSRLVGPQGTVLAVEPSQRCLPALLDLTRSASLHNVVVHPVALAASEGEAQLMDVDRTENSGLATLRDRGSADISGMTSVPTRRLDQLPEVLKAPEIALLKVDVEGFEAQVLEGGWSLFADGRVRSAIIEITPGVADVDAIGSRLSRLDDYRAFRIGESGVVRRRAALTPVTAPSLHGDGGQYNLLLTRIDALPRVARLIASGAS